MTTDEAAPSASDARARLRKLNDAFRRSFVGGQVVMTAAVAALAPELVAAIVDSIKAFDRFDADNDPYGEHDFGAIEVDGLDVFWKIDYFDRALRCHSPDAGDPDRTHRVLTIMLANDY